jgi:hypothetical protein
MLNIDTEPLVMAFKRVGDGVMAFKREVAKMSRPRRPDQEIQAMLEFVEQSIRWREEENREPLVSALREAAGLPH